MPIIFQQYTFKSTKQMKRIAIMNIYQVKNVDTQ